MPTKHNYKQHQSLTVVVNNNIKNNVEKPKRKRPKKKPELSQGGQAPIDPLTEEFPVLNTPADSRPSIHPVPVRNTVYTPSTVQISPVGMSYPIPHYFDRPYTNLERTMEDLRNSLMNEMNDVRSLISGAQKVQTNNNDTQTDAMNQAQTTTQTDAMNHTQSESQTDTATSANKMSMSEPQILYEVEPKKRRKKMSMSEPQTLYDLHDVPPLHPPDIPFQPPSPPPPPSPQPSISQSPPPPQPAPIEQEEPNPLIEELTSNLKSLNIGNAPQDDTPDDYLTTTAEYQHLSDDEVISRYRKYIPNRTTEGRTRASLITALIRNAKTRLSNRQ